MLLANQSINNGLIRTTNTVRYTGGNGGNGSSATPIEAIDQGAVDTTIALYNILIGSVPRSPVIPAAPLPNSTLYRQGCNIIQYNNTGAVQWISDISGVVSGYNLTTDGQNVYVVGDFSGAILFINSDRTYFTTPTSITTTGNGSFIVKYNPKGITQWAAYLTSQSFLQLLDNVTDSINNYQAGNGFLNINVYNSNGRLYDILNENITLYNPRAITNDGTFIYIIDSNPRLYKFKTTGEIVYTLFLGGYGLSANITSVTWMSGYLYIVDNKATIWQLTTTLDDPPVPPTQFITKTDYPDISGSVSITANLTDRLYIINSQTPNVITTVTVINSDNPPSLVSVDTNNVDIVDLDYPDGIISPLAVSYTYNGGTGYLILTDSNIDSTTTLNYYPDLSGIVWRVGPVSSNNYTLNVLATTSTDAGIIPNANNFNYALSPYGVYSIYNNTQTILTTYISLRTSNTYIRFNYNFTVVSNKRITNLGGAINLVNTIGLNNTFYVLDDTAVGSIYSVNYPTNVRITSKKLYPLSAYYNNGFVIQYNPSGAVSWISQFRSVNANCTVNAITIGKTGIFITGSYGTTGNLIFYNKDGNSSGIVLQSVSNSTPLSAFVAKYTTAGNAVWAAAIGNTNSTTSGTAIYVSTVNNIDSVYAAGIYYGTRSTDPLRVYSADGTLVFSLSGFNSGSAGYLVNYDVSGVAQWATNNVALTTNTVNAITGNNTDIYLVGNAIGNIICNNANNSAPFGPINISVLGNGVIIKYSSAGIVQWVTTLFGGIPYYVSVFGTNLFVSGQMTNPVSLNNVPYDISGGVIPPPSGQPIYSGFSVPLRGSRNDFLITYTTAGIAQWGQNTSSPYVTTTSTGGLTYGKNVEYVSVSIQPPSNATALYLYGNNVIKYTNTGRLSWVADISGAFTNFGNLGTDGTNIYGSGTYFFDPATNINNSIPIIINANKTITITSNIVATQGESGSFLVKYNTSGIAQWTNNLNNLFAGLIVHDGGRLYTAGFAGPGYGKAGVSPTIYNVNGTVFKSYDYVTTSYVLQYSTDGNPVWCSKISFDSVFGGCVLRGITVSSSGVYVVGGFGSYLFNGEQQLSVIRFFNANDTDTGISLTTGADSATFVAKYNTSGTPLWATKVEYNTGGTDGNTNAASIAIDSASPNSIYMLGEYTSFNIGLPVNVYSASSQIEPTKQVYGGFGIAMILVKYDAAGDVQWAVNIRSTNNDLPNNTIAPGGLAVSAGFIYITGYAYLANLSTYDPTNSTTDPSTGTQPIQTGNPMLWSGIDGSKDGVLVTYNTDGIPQWKTHVTGTDMTLGSVTTGGGFIYVGGVFTNNVNPPIITFYNTPDGTVNSNIVLTNSASANNFTVAYNLQGKVQWVQNTCGPGINALAADSVTYANAVFVAAPGTGIATATA